MGPGTGRNERFRRKCLEHVYVQLAALGAFNVTLESRSLSEDRKDLEHIVSRQGAGLSRSLRVRHERGGVEPLLAIPDAVLGALKSAGSADEGYLRAIANTVVSDTYTAESQ